MTLKVRCHALGAVVYDGAPGQVHIAMDFALPGRTRVVTVVHNDRGMWTLAPTLYDIEPGNTEAIRALAEHYLVAAGEAIFGLPPVQQEAA